MNPAGRWSVWRRRGAEWVGPAITIVIAALSQFLADTPLRVPNPPAFLVLSIVFSAFQGGLAAGLLSAIIAWAEVALFFSNPGESFVYTDENLRRVIVWGVTMPATAALVGLLQRRAARARVAEARKDLLEEQMAAQLETEAMLAARARQQAVIAELGRLGLASTDLQRLFDRATEGVAQSFGMEYCEVLALEPDGTSLTLVSGVGWKAGLVGQVTIGAQPDQQVGFTLHGKAPVIVNDLATETRFRGTPLLQDHGVVSGLTVLIGDPDQPFGVLGAYTAHRRTFAPEDVTLVQSVANVLAVAIQRIRAEEELRRAAAHLASVTAVSPAVLYTLEVRGNTLVPTWISENVTSLVGYSREEALHPEWWTTHVHDEDRAMAIAETVRPGGLGDRLSHEYRFLRKDGTMLWIRDEQHLLRTENGAPREIVGAWVDVTERRHLEEQFLQAQKMDTVGRLAGGVAHDFNNMLTVITNTVDLARPRLPAGDPLATELEEIRRAAERAAALTRQLLAFSRRQIMRLEVLDLNTPLKEMESMLPRVLGENITLVIRRGGAPGNIRADPGQLAQIIMNLAVNARDAMAAGGTLTLETASVDLDLGYARHHPDVVPGPYAMLTVTDTGVGMNEATRRRIFEPFFTTKAPGQGTGLGLSTVYGIVTQTGGHISVDSAVGEGSTFSVYFPRVAEPVADASRPRAVEPARGTETILVVEDEAAVRKLVQRILQRAGFVVHVAESLAEALLIVEHHGNAIRLLLTDVVMPGMSGPDLAEQLQVRRPDLKVLYMSGYTEDVTVSQGVLGREAPFIGKPFDGSALTRKVREVLDA